jgi:5,10-methenyltetrahydromethanopterin hydrogenase
MTQMEVIYRYHATPGEAAFRAIDNVSEVYGIRKISFNHNDRTVRVEFDASRLKEPVIAGLLRRAGIDIGERLIPA